ncbi:MAG: DMT family transporter [Actinomycetota bacterium]|nr:DMT family transporter [Actinomycetota bacterium]
MSRPVAVICALAAGGLVALQAPANSSLSEHVSDLGAALVSLALSATIIATLLLVVGHPGRLSGLSAFKPEHVIGGLAGAAIVSVSLVAVRPLGVGGLTSVLVAAQLIVSVAADRFGWFGLDEIGLTPSRWAGLALVIAGTILVTRT